MLCSPGNTLKNKSGEYCCYVTYVILCGDKQQRLNESTEARSLKDILSGLGKGKKVSWFAEGVWRGGACRREMVR